MKKISLIIILILFFFQIRSQQLNAKVDINYSLIGVSNKIVFEKLKRSLSEYINNSNFINTNYNENERIECEFFIIIHEMSSDGTVFFGTLQIQSYRPVFGTDYSTPIFTYIDKSINFKYSQDEPLIYNSFLFTSNLLSIIDYYCYLIIGLDQDSFSLDGGSEAFQKANKVVDIAISEGIREWLISEKNSRSIILDHILSDNFYNFRVSIYEYHIKGLDGLYLKEKNIYKQNIMDAMNKILDIYETQQNSVLLDGFILSKYREIDNIFTEKNKIDRQDLFVDRLSKYSSNFSAIRKKS